jgi:hypothetical protein
MLQTVGLLLMRPRWFYAEASPCYANAGRAVDVGTLMVAAIPQCVCK